MKKIADEKSRSNNAYQLNNQDDKSKLAVVVTNSYLTAIGDQGIHSFEENLPSSYEGTHRA